MDDALKEELARHLHSLWTKWTKEFLRGCSPIDSRFLGDMSLVVPDDHRRRTSIKMSLGYGQLQNGDKKKLLSEVDELVRLIESSKFDVYVSSLKRRNDETILSATPSVVWQSMECKSGINGYESSFATAEELSSFMDDEERVSFINAVKQLARDAKPVVQIKADSTRNVCGRGVIKVVRCDAKLASRIKDILNTTIVIDDVDWFVTSVECFNPVKEGDLVSIVVRKPKGSERLIKCVEHGWSHTIVHDDIDMSMCEKCYPNDGPPFFYIDFVEGENE